jgi:hypothetical protein
VDHLQIDLAMPTFADSLTADTCHSGTVLVQEAEIRDLTSMTNTDSDQRQNFVGSSVDFPYGIEPDSPTHRYLRLQVVL